MALRASDLFDAYAKSLLPKDQGFIVSSFFDERSAYTRYEIVSYDNIKSIYPQEDGLTFHTDGKKMYILLEPANYPTKGIEPYCRKSNEQIPLRFSELDTFTTKNQTKVMIAKKEVMSFGSFTVIKPKGINTCFIFYPLPDMYDTMHHYFENSLWKEVQIPKSDATKCADKIVANVKMIMKLDYEK